MSFRSVEDLLQILKDAPETRETSGDVEEFINYYEIISSETSRVTTRLLYWRYLNWKDSGHGKQDVMTKVDFSRKFSKYFKRGQGKKRFFYIDDTHFQSSPEELERIKDDINAERNRLWRKRKKVLKEKK